MVSLMHHFGLNLPISEFPRCLSSAPAPSNVTIRRCKSIRPRTLRPSSVGCLEVIPILNIQTGFRNQLEMQGITENNS